MKRLTMIMAIFAALIMPPASADDRLPAWASRSAMITANLLIVTDWAQTRYIADHPDYYEMNPLLGEHPSSGKVNKYFGRALLATNIIGYVLPKEWRGIWYLGVFSGQLSTVQHNYQIGIQMEF